MPFQSLQLKNFRNLKETEWFLAPGLNVLEGENAQGKSNFLEALYVLANGHSFRTSENSSLMAWGSPFVQLKTQIEHQGLTSEIVLKLQPEKPFKQLFLNGKSKRSFKELYSLLRVLVFTPDSTLLFRSSPGVRRRYLDQATAWHYPSYGTILSRYERTLKHRNRLLEQRAPLSLRESFDQQWAEFSLQLLLARQEYLKELIPLWQKRLGELTQSHGSLTAKWAGPLSEKDPRNSSDLLELLATVQMQEERRGRTLLGPHREDFTVHFNQKPVKEVASQGQHRMLTISLKLAEADLFVEKTGNSPVFLLDDVGSELDERHLRALLKILGELHSQTVLTTAHRGEYASLAAKTYTVRSGKLIL